MSPTLTSEIFYPLVVTSLGICLIFPLIINIIFLSVTIFFTAQLLRATNCNTLELLHCQSQLHNLLTQSHDIILPLCLNWAHTDALPCIILLLWLSFLGCCHQLRISYPCIIIQVVHRVPQLLMQLIKMPIPEMLLHLISTQHCWIFFLHCIQFSFSQVMYNVTLPCCNLQKFCIKISKDAMVPYTSSKLLIISETRACGPRY